MPGISRRRFLKGSAALASGTFAIGGCSQAIHSKASGRVRGANERIRVGIAGLHGRGGDAHLPEYLKMENVEVAYLIDPDKRVLDKRNDQAQKGGAKPTLVQDVRKALEDKDVDVISIATPNHWHSLITIWACQAGKDVYVEKPCSHNIREGRLDVEMARKYGRIVQHGTQSRSDANLKKTAAAIASDKLGKVKVSRGLCYKSSKGNSTRVDIGFAPIKAPPAELDFNIWLGPAPQQPFHENLVHYRWHWFWDFGNGDIGNQGVHQMDIARWMIPNATLPKSVISVGGRFGPKDQGESANTQIAIFDYGDTQLIFEVRGFKSKKYMGEEVGNIVHLDSGTVTKNKFTPKGSNTSEPLPEMSVPLHPGEGNNFKNFIAAVRSRKQSDLNAPILEGHYSAALCHLANASYRLGEMVPFNQKTKAFGDNKDAYETFGRMEEHLTDNGLALNDLQYRLGRKLTINPKTELTDDADANAILKGTYRNRFDLPHFA